MTRFKHDNNQRNFWNTLNDALVMERLSASPRIVDIYGHCAYSVWVEVRCDCDCVGGGRGMKRSKAKQSNESERVVWVLSCMFAAIGATDLFSFFVFWQHVLFLSYTIYTGNSTRSRGSHHQGGGHGKARRSIQGRLRVTE
mmetsp:Transcript_19134/g.53272  ORF Transcript_19134/g.53272 Transcript_19134/m.53272 type:complete len:141 (+) Transcript_19134:2089-2511(+)